MKKAQSMTEMVVLVVAMTVALLSLGRYMQRGYSGKIRSMADSGLGSQFDPQNTKTQILNSQKGTVGYKVSFHNTTESGVVGSSSNRLYAKSSQVVGDYTDPMTSTRISRTSTAYLGEDAELAGLGMVAAKKVVKKDQGSTTNNDNKKVIDNNTKIDDEKIADQSGKTTGDNDSDSGSDVDNVVITPPQTYCWYRKTRAVDCPASKTGCQGCPSGCVCVDWCGYSWPSWKRAETEWKIFDCKTLPSDSDITECLNTSSSDCRFRTGAYGSSGVRCSNSADSAGTLPIDCPAYVPVAKRPVTKVENTDYNNCMANCMKGGGMNGADCSSQCQ